MKRILEFLRLGVIVGPYPNQILNGQIEDAVPVMNDFNWVRDQVNANVPALIPTVTTFSTYVAAAAVGGSANAITLTPSPAIGAYAEGQSFRFQATNTNTGSVTIATSGLAVRALQTAASTALTGGEIKSGGEYDICDTGTVYQLVNASQGTGITTYTPVLSFGGASVGITYAVQLGTYFKMGPLVFFSFDLLLTNKGSSVGQAVVSGLPFTSAGWPAGGIGASCAAQMKNTDFGGAPGYVVGVVESGGGTHFSNVIHNAAITLLTDISFANNSEVSATGYFPAA